jgi:2-dehydropantoate 2-reductase
VANGVGAEQAVAEARPGAGLIAGSLTTALERAGALTVARLNDGGIAIARVQGEVTAVVGELLVAFRSGSVRAEGLFDPMAMKWSKLVANLVGNATSAILDLSPAEIYADAGAFRIEQRQLREALAVMSRKGMAVVPLPGANVPLLAMAARLPAGLSRPILRRVVGGARGGKDPSLRIHVRSASGPSEVDWLNGAVARAATELGGQAPVNRRLAELVGEVIADPDRRAWFRGRTDRLVDDVASTERRLRTKGAGDTLPH